MLVLMGKQRTAIAAAALIAMIGLLAQPITAHADGDRGKKENKGGQTIVIGAPKIVPDPSPSNPPPKKPKKDR